MTTDQYIYDSGMGALANVKGFATPRKAISVRRKGRPGTTLNFLGLHSDAEKFASFELAARTEFPYPPKNCADAVSSASALAAKIAILNEDIASGIDIKNNQSRIAALNKVKEDFDVYVNKANCVAAALASEDSAFNQQWQDLLNNEQSAESKNKGADTWIVFGALGLLFVVALVVIFKKGKPKSE